MKPTLSEIAAAMKAAETKTSSGDPHRIHYYGGFTKAAVGTTTIVRILPDGNVENVMPHVEKLTIRMPFAASINSDFPIDDECTVVVPCAKTWGLPCLINAATRHLWKGSEEEKALARVYYPKKAFICQGFVVSGSVVEEETPENPIRLFSFTKQIFDCVKAGILDGDLEDNPFDDDAGHDFKVIKTSQGGFNSYVKSVFAGKPRSLNPAERAAKEQFGLWNLSDEIGPEPDPSVWQMTKAMLADSLAGEAFDARKYAPFRAFPALPNGVGSGVGGGDTKANPPADPNHSIVQKLRERTANKVAA